MMTDDCSVHPDALLESVLSVDRLIQPALARMGIITVGQMAGLNVRSLSKERSIGVKKLQILASLSAAAEEKLRQGSSWQDPTASDSRPGRGKSRSRREKLPLAFVPSILKNPLKRCGIRTVHDLLAVDPDSLTRLRGWSTGKVQLLRSLRQVYQQMLSETPSSFVQRPLVALVPECFLPDSKIGKRLIREVIAVDFHWAGPPSTAVTDFTSLRNLIRHWMNPDSRNRPEPPRERRSDSTGIVPDIPLFFLPTILENRILDLQPGSFAALNAVDAWKLPDLSGWGSRKTEAFVAVKDLYQALFSDRKFTDDSSRLSDLPGAETLFDHDVCSMRLCEIIESSAEWIGLSGSMVEDYTGLRVLLQLARLQDRIRGERPAEVMSCLSPEIDQTIRWKEIPLEIPARGRTFLDRFKVETLGEVDQLAITGKVRRSGKSEFRSLTDLRGFTLQTLQAIRMEMLQLSLLGLERYRYGECGKPATCTDVVAQVRALMTERQLEILEERSSGATLAKVAARWNVTRERVRQIELDAAEMGGRFKAEATEILEPLHAHLRCHRMITLSAALKLVGAESFWELYLTATIARHPIHWRSARSLSLLVSSTELNVQGFRHSQWIFQTDDGIAAVRTNPSPGFHKKTAGQKQHGRK